MSQNQEAVVHHPAPPPPAPASGAWSLWPHALTGSRRSAPTQWQHLCLEVLDRSTQQHAAPSLPVRAQRREGSVKPSCSIVTSARPSIQYRPCSLHLFASCISLPETSTCRPIFSCLVEALPLFVRPTRPREPRSFAPSSPRLIGTTSLARSGGYEPPRQEGVKAHGKEGTHNGTASPMIAR